MKTINTYNIVKDDWICYNSKICSAACSLGYINQFSPLDNRIDELVKSFFNQWQFVISTYQKLCEMLDRLNKCSDAKTVESIFSEYDNESANSEVDFKNYSYLLVVSLKTYLDLFACLVDIIQNQVIREERKMPDFYNLGQSNRYDLSSGILAEFNKLRDKDIYLNRIERNNLTLRTRLRRLNRKTICFSKSLEMLECSLKLYLWA